VKLFIDVTGWIGALSLVVAYALVSTHRVEPGSWSYQGLNLVGAAGLMLNSVYYTAYPSTAVNVIWGVIAVAAMWKLLSDRRRAAS
jgi:hypothetical protein